MARARGRQGDTSSSSLANNNVAQKDKNFNESQRLKGSIPRDEGRQVDTSSTSLTDKNIPSSQRDGKSILRSTDHQPDVSSSSLANETVQLSDRQAKSDPDLQAAMAQVDADANELQARLGHMSGELKRNADGVARQDSEKRHAADGRRLQEIARKTL